MKTIEEILKMEEYQELPNREQRALLMAVDGIERRKRGQTVQPMRVEITIHKEFDVFGFRKACMSAGLETNMPEKGYNNIYVFQPEESVEIKKIEPRNISEILWHGSAALRKEIEVNRSSRRNI